MNHISNLYQYDNQIRNDSDRSMLVGTSIDQLVREGRSFRPVRREVNPVYLDIPSASDILVEVNSFSAKTILIDITNKPSGDSLKHFVDSLCWIEASSSGEQHVDLRTGKVISDVAVKHFLLDSKRTWRPSFSLSTSIRGGVMQMNNRYVVNERNFVTIETQVHFTSLTDEKEVEVMMVIVDGTETGQERSKRTYIITGKQSNRYSLLGLHKDGEGKVTHHLSVCFLRRGCYRIYSLARFTNSSGNGITSDWWLDATCLMISVKSVSTHM